jgi:hypothetical protein
MSYGARLIGWLCLCLTLWFAALYMATWIFSFGSLSAYRSNGNDLLALVLYLMIAVFGLLLVDALVVTRILLRLRRERLI